MGCFLLSAFRVMDIGQLPLSDLLHINLCFQSHNAKGFSVLPENPLLVPLYHLKNFFHFQSSGAIFSRLSLISSQAFSSNSQLRK